MPDYPEKEFYISIAFLSGHRYNIYEVMILTLNRLMLEMGISRYSLSKISGVPWDVLSDICQIHKETAK